MLRPQRNTGRLALCIPAWNAERFLGRLLDTARAQTSSFDELLVYDDASTDSTAEVARSYGATVVRGDVNRGPSHGKNELAQLSRCEWLHFHDADEALNDRFVEHARHWIALDSADVVLFATEDRDDETGAFLHRSIWNDPALVHDALAYMIRTTVTNCGVYRRSAFEAAGGFDVNDLTKYNEDQAMHLRLALAGLRFRADSYVGIIVYRRPGSMSSGHPIECARAQFEVLRQVASRVAPSYTQEIGERLWHLATLSATYSDWRYMQSCLTLASELGYSRPAGERRLVRAFARVSPLAAILAREGYVRLCKPGLRRGVPRVR